MRRCHGGRRGVGASSRSVQMLVVQGTCPCMWCMMRVSGRIRTRGDMHGRGCTQRASGWTRWGSVGGGVTADEGCPWQGEGSGKANAIGKPFALCKVHTRITPLKHYPTAPSSSPTLPSCLPTLPPPVTRSSAQPPTPVHPFVHSPSHPLPFAHSFVHPATHLVCDPFTPLTWRVLEFVQACRSLHIRLVICDSDYIVSSHMSHRDSASWLSSTNISKSWALLASLQVRDSYRLWAYRPRFVSDPSLGTNFRQVELTDTNFNLTLAFYITLCTMGGTRLSKLTTVGQNTTNFSDDQKALLVLAGIFTSPHST